MTTLEAVALYRAEKADAIARGANITTAKPIPGSHHRRTPALDSVNGVYWPRADAFRVIPGRP